MWRPRKGSTFRVPTAADSAASADATEDFRRRASQPQDKAPVGQTIVVKTPVDGIPARDENTIFWEKCQRCIERYTPDQKEIVDTDEEIIVFNLFAEVVPGDTYVPTLLTEGGTRYAHQAHQIVGFTLTEDMGNTTAGEASATLSRTWVAASEGYTGSETMQVKDVQGIFSAATSGSTGVGQIRLGNDREIIEPFNMSCP